MQREEFGDARLHPQSALVSIQLLHSLTGNWKLAWTVSSGVCSQPLSRQVTVTVQSGDGRAESVSGSLSQARHETEANIFLLLRQSAHDCYQKINKLADLHSARHIYFPLVLESFWL